MIQSFNRIKKISGSLTLPGDKSISHRALIFSAMAKGESEITNLPQSDDISSTINCLCDLGVEIIIEEDHIKVYGNGYRGFKKPDKPLNAGNSGTTARLLSGILVAQDFDSVIEGDESLSKRPMLRIIEPLNKMGARISGYNDEMLPLKILDSGGVKSFTYEMPVPSAQVKSAIIFAGLHSEEITKIIESNPTRDHTERMLGLDVERNQVKSIISVSKSNYPVPQKYFIPGDFSTSTFFILLAILLEKSKLSIENISLNPSRITLINLLKEMGANIKIDKTGASNAEPFGNITVVSSKLKNIVLNREMVTSIIDEIPVLAAASIFAAGEFELRNALELRLKESDRISTICYNLSLLGLEVEEYEDGFKISGNIKNKKPTFKSFGDHRIAMAFGILSCLLDEGGKVEGFECVSVSNPKFLKQLNSITS